MGFPLPIPPLLRAALPPGTSVLVALSGGVDSSVALAMLHALGCRVASVTFKNFCYADDTLTTEKSCCSQAAIDDARRLAYAYDVEHWVTDVSAKFQHHVIDPFVQEYSAGRTPNPCLGCNSEVRFPHLVRLADQMGMAMVATGHYARLESRDGGVRLLRGLDEAKDQAYFLYRVDRQLFSRLVFPLGWYRKEQVRVAAQALGLPVASKHDSQEVCFIPDGDRSFLFSEVPDNTPGEIVDTAGKVVGRHRGLVHYTVGQRRGLGIAAPQPLYVLNLDRERNRVVVGTERELGVRRISCDRFVTTAPSFPASGPAKGYAQSLLARVRHRHVGAAVMGWRQHDDRLEVELANEVRGVAPGQSLVLYQGDEVLGGGRIRSAV
jgi:tRNA-specific 2-thiouridylase